MSKASSRDKGLPHNSFVELEHITAKAVETYVSLIVANSFVCLISLTKGENTLKARTMTEEYLQSCELLLVIAKLLVCGALSSLLHNSVLTRSIKNFSCSLFSGKFLFSSDTI